MTALRSHYDPNLLLGEHVAQVRAAAEAILQRHALLPADCQHVVEWIFGAVQLHDAGKGTSAFQAYITNPQAWRGNKICKAHTPLSFICSLEYGRAAGWTWRKRLAVAALAASHHSRFKTTSELERNIEDPRLVDVIEQQIAELDWDALDDALDISLSRIDPIDDPCGVLLDEMDELFSEFGPLRSQDLPEAVRYRLLCQYAFSVLLEADKAFLAVKPEHLPKYLYSTPIPISPEIVTEFLQRKEPTPLDHLRQEARKTLEAELARTRDRRILTMTLPTGSGKTLLAASWALSMREQMTARDGQVPKIIIVLPYLSVIDQTQREWCDLLKPLGDSAAPTSYHSLSERNVSAALDLDDDASEFFLDTWQADIVVTTFDQVLFALFDPRARYQMRFHNLCDALIVMDEVQVLPCGLWHPLASALRELVRLGSTRVLAMSATQPGFLAKAESHELISLPDSLFARMDRYRLILKHQSPPWPLADFVEEITTRAESWKNQRVLLVLNTRRSARILRDALVEMGQPVLFLSADVTPKDRLQCIETIKEKIKANEPCLVVSTQCIEAGVDIDMDLVIRDFAPLDSLIQVAGRCNRHAKRNRCDVEIVSLADDGGRAFAPRIYDPILLQATRVVLGNLSEVAEEGIFPLISAYYRELLDKKDQGERHTTAWIYWQEMESPIRILFRGEEAEQLSFVVIEQDRHLEAELTRVATIRDRWARRREHRKLAARLSGITVSTYVLHGRGHLEIDPADYATQDATSSHWLLRPGFYNPERGLDLNLSEEQSQSSLLI